MRLLFAMVVLLVGVGCQSVPAPSAEVVGARVVDASFAGASVEVSLVLANPGDEPLPLTIAEYTVSVEGMGEYSFYDEAAKVVPAHAEQSVSLPAAVTFAKDEAGGRGLEGVSGRKWSVRGRVEYEPDNDWRALQTESGVPLPDVGFAGEGVLE